MAKNKIQSNIDQLQKIGDLLTKRDESDRPIHPVINDKVKSVFEESFNMLKQKQDSMSEATDYQKQLLNRLFKTLVDIRQVDDFDSLIEVRKEVIKIEKKAEEDTSGNPDIKKFISDISSKIYNDTKFSNKDKTMSFVKGTIKQLSPFAFFDMSKLKDKRGSVLSKDTDDTLSEIDASVAEKKETFDNKRKSKSDKLASQAKTPVVSQKSEPTSAKVGETFIDEKRTTYEKYATGWRDIASGKMATKAEQERINVEYNKQMESSTPKVKLGSDPVKKSDNSISKITELKIDKAIIKELKIDKDALDKLVDAITSRKGETENTVETDNSIIPDIDIDIGKRGSSRTPTPTKSGGLKRVLGSAKSLLGGVGRVATAAAPLAIPAALAYGAANAIDYGAGKLFGVGKDETGEDLQVDEKTDDANWNKMSAFQKMQSGLARGVEYAGSAVGLSNIARSVEVGRIDRESKMFGGEPKETSSTSIQMSDFEFLKKDPENYRKYEQYKNQKTKEYIDTGEDEDEARIQAKLDATEKFKSEIEKAGADKVNIDERYVQPAKTIEESIQRESIESKSYFNEKILLEKDPENYKKFKEYVDQNKKEYIESDEYKKIPRVIEAKARKDVIEKFKAEIEKASDGNVNIDERDVQPAKTIEILKQRNAEIEKAGADKVIEILKQRNVQPAKTNEESIQRNVQPAKTNEESIQRNVQPAKTIEILKQRNAEIEKASDVRVPISAKPTASKELTTDIDKMTKSIDSKKAQSAAPVIITNPTPAAPAKETVIMPVKGSVRPSDSSFNRFQDRVFAGF